MPEHVEIEELYQLGAEFFRVQIIQMDGGDCDSPRTWTNGSILCTGESSYVSPDPREYLPSELDQVVNRWIGNNFSRPVPAARVARYARAYHPDTILAIGGLSRGQYDLSVDWDPQVGAWYDGLAVVTRDSWNTVMGDGSDPAGGEITLEGVALVGARYPSARELVEQELDTYNRWARGECYGYVVERAVKGGWEETQAVWGYIEAPDGYPLSEARGFIPEGAVKIDAMPETRSLLNPVDETPGDVYIRDLEGLIEGFKTQLCGECDLDLEQHVIAPDMFGKPHVWCLQDDWLRRFWLERWGLRPVPRGPIRYVNVARPDHEPLLRPMTEQDVADGRTEYQS